MGQSKTLDVRMNIVSMKQSGHTNAQISESLQIGLGTVKNIWKRFQILGEPGLPDSFGNCGKRAGGESLLAFRLVRLLRHLHPGWGMPFILLKVAGKYPGLKLPSARHCQRLLSAGSGKVPKSALPPAPAAEKARTAHDTWQIDAKELVRLGNGDLVCYLSVVDEATGSLLAARAFPPQPYQQGARGGDMGLPPGPVPGMDDAKGHPHR